MSNFNFTELNTQNAVEKSYNNSQGNQNIQYTMFPINYGYDNQNICENTNIMPCNFSLTASYGYYYNQYNYFDEFYHWMEFKFLFF